MSELEGYLLSQQQQRVWSLGGTRLRAQVLIRLSGRLDVGQLRRALQTVVERHEILRTTFVRAPGMAFPVQEVHPFARLDLQLLDWSPPDKIDLAAQASELLLQQREAPLAPEQGPLLGVHLAYVTPDLHFLALTLPSLLADGRSLQLLTEELMTVYDDRPEELVEEPLQYPDFCAWQEDLLEDPEAQTGRAFWQQRFAPTAEPRLPFERTEAAEAPSWYRVSRPIHDLYQIVATLPGATGRPEDAILAAWLVLLKRLGEEQPRIGLEVEGRPFEELATALGLFASAVPLLADLDPSGTFARAVEAVRAAREQAETLQQTFTWERSGSEAGPQRFPFLFTAWPKDPVRGSGEVRMSLAELFSQVDEAKLVLLFWRSNRDDQLLLQADSARYDPGDSERHLARLEALLVSAREHPERALRDLDFLAEAERRQLLGEWAGESSPLGRGSVPELFHQRAQQHPDAIAASDGRQISYGHLARLASAFGHRLHEQGCQDETPVGLCCSASIEFLIGILATFRAGGAFLPLEPTAPGERNLRLLHSLPTDELPLLLLAGETDAALRRFSGPILDLDPPDVTAEPDSAPAPHPSQLAYVLFTSGSTGHPKGVAVSHGSLVAYAAWVVEGLLQADADAGLRFAMASTPAADLGHTCLFPALISGGRLDLLSPRLAADAARFARYLDRQQPDVLKIVPGHFQALMPAGRGPRLPRHLIFGGERLEWDLVERLARLDPNLRLINHYGPTETTVGALFHPLGQCPTRQGEEGSVPIGRPIAGARTRILDPSLRLSPVGVPGELCLGGRGLARGYLGQPARTAEAFLPDPFANQHGERLYRTGDRVRHLNDGRVEFLGRLDDQVKVRGFRVEPAEVAAVLQEHPQVADAVVLCTDRAAGRLSAYYTAESVEPTEAEKNLGATRAALLPNGLRIEQCNRHETAFFYQQIFVQRSCFLQGLTLHENALVLDVGANIGLFSLFVARHFPGARILAFEPAPTTFDCLRQNLTRHAPRAEAFPWGLGEESREVEFTYYPRESCMSSFYADPGRDRDTLARVIGNAHPTASAEDLDHLLAERVESQVLVCELRPLSRLIREQGLSRVDLLKIDVERAELSVLRGLDDEDWPKVQQIVIEAHDEAGRLQELTDLLRAKGFAVRVEQPLELAGTNLFDVLATRQGWAPPARLHAEPDGEIRSLTETLSAEDLRGFAAERLPNAMQPADYVLLESLPRTPNGKVDRRRLPDPQAVTSEATTPFVAPRGSRELLLAEVWEQVLGVERVGVDDDFFALGGDSIRVIQVRYLAEERGLVLSAEDILETPSIRRLAARARTEPGSTAEPPAPFSLLNAEDRQSLPDDLADAYPMTALQAGMLFHSLYSEGAAAYRDIQSLHLACPLDVDALRISLAQVVARHGVLRTCFDLTTYSEPLQLVRKQLDVPLVYEDLSILGEVEQEAALAAWMEDEKQQRFDWRQGPLLRVAAHRRSSTHFQLGVVHHHAILDGWSNTVFLSEWLRLYLAHLNAADGAPVTSPLPPAPVATFQEFVALERQTAQQEKSETFWRELQEDARPCLLDRWPSATGGDAAGQTRVLELDPGASASQQITTVARALEVPLKSALLAVHVATLAKARGDQRVVTGLVSNGRPESAHADRALGLFLATLPFSLRLHKETWQSLARRCFEIERSMAPHRRFPVDRLATADGAQALYETLFNFNHFHHLEQARDESGVEVLDWRTFEETNLTLTTSFHREPSTGRLRLDLRYNPNALTTPQVHQLGQRYLRALEAFARDPQGSWFEVDVLALAERQQILHEWNDQAVSPAPWTSVREPIEGQARQTPERIAVISSQGWLSYGELDRRAERVARYLRQLGLAIETPVGLCCELSPSLMIGILGTFKAGVCYAALDPQGPAARVRPRLDDLQTTVLLTQESLLSLSEGFDGDILLLDRPLPEIEDPVETASPESQPAQTLAYILFTSGSTGKPKGVAIDHRSLVNYCRWTIDEMLVEPPPGHSATGHSATGATPAADAGLTSTFPALMTGGTIHFLPPEVIVDRRHFQHYLQRHPLTLLKIVPSLLLGLLEAGEPLPRHLCVGGEAMPWRLVDLVADISPGSRLMNHYGPTEATVGALRQPLSPAPAPAARGASPPIGHPLTGYSAHVLDERFEPLPIGVPGGLYLGGLGVARGYLNRPRETAARFLPDPFSGRPGARLYDTGDRARYLPDGAVEFLGRRDHQLSLHGIRFEPGDVEEALRRLDAILDAVVIVHRPEGSEAGRQQLVAYCVAENGPLPEPRDLRRALREVLPEPLIPALFIDLEALPRLANGKVNRAALPAPGGAATATYQAPINEIEKRLADIWASVLRREQVGTEDDFFTLGGDSILSLQIVVRAQDAGLRITPRQVFEHPTIAALAQVIDQAPIIDAEQGRVRGEVPLTPLQRQFFARELKDPHHFNQSLLLQVPPAVDRGTLANALRAIGEHHDALRCRFTSDGAHLDADPDLELAIVDLRGLNTEDLNAAQSQAAESLQAGLDFENGPLMRAVLFQQGGSEDDQLLLIAHHLAVDAVSWRILHADLERVCRSSADLPPKTTSIRTWGERLRRHARSSEVENEKDFWLQQANEPIVPLPCDPTEGGNRVADQTEVSVELEAETTQHLLEMKAEGQNPLEELLLGALLHALSSWNGGRALLIDLEHQGREPFAEDLDLSRTVGWFTCRSPLWLQPDDSPAACLATVRERLRLRPGSGFGYGLLREFGADPQTRTLLANAAEPEVSFNYFGQLDLALPEDILLTPIHGPTGRDRSPRGQRAYLLEVNAMTYQDRLRLDWTFSSAIHRRQTIERMAGEMLDALRALAQNPEAEATSRLGVEAEDLTGILAELNQGLDG